MFFIGIFGIQDKEKVIREFDGVICPECGRFSRAELIEYYTYFHFFFIPLFSWNRRYFVRFRCCNSMYAIDGDYVKEIQNGEGLDTNRLVRIGRQENICPNCGSYVNPAFNYCPNCGQKLY